MTKIRAAAIFCLLPWIVFAILSLIFKIATPQMSVLEITNVVCAIWMVLSPAITALGVLVIYREGQYSRSGKIASLEDEVSRLRTENAKLKPHPLHGVFEFD